MTSLGSKGLTIGDIDLGSFDAESEPRLDEDFIMTRYVGAALRGRSHVFLGRKGSGKSALFDQLPRLADKNPDKTAKVVQLSPDVYAWSALKGYRELGIPSIHAHSNAWKLTIAVEVAVALLSDESKTWKSTARQNLSTLKDFIGDNLGDVRTNGLNASTSILANLSSFNISALGFAAGGSRDSRATQKQILTPALTTKLLSLLRAPLEEARVILELDRLDDAWDGSDEAKSLLVGLLIASKSLNDMYKPIAGDRSGFHALVFLRTDIYDVLKFDDKDKHRPFEDSIIWTEDSLRDLINKRLPAGINVDDIFEDGVMRGTILPFDHMLKRTFLRPREVLQFLDLCLRDCDLSATAIAKQNVHSVEANFSSWKIADLKQEYEQSRPELSLLIEALRQGVHRYDTYDELVTVLKRRQPTLVEKLSERKAVEILFDASVIGVRLNDAGSTRFRSLDPSLSLPVSGAFYVHQSLIKGLNLTEARRL